MKKDVRRWYRDNLQQKIEPFLRKWNLSYFIDPELPEGEKRVVIVRQKTDRQIIVLIALVYQVLEWIYDFASAMICPKKP